MLPKNSEAAQTKMGYIFMCFKELENFLINTAKEKQIGNFCCVIHKGREELFKISYSDDNIDSSSCDSKHWIYSMTKPITVLMGIILLERGVMRLDDKLSKYFSEFESMNIKENDEIKKAENDILIEHLFNMTAGFNYDIFSPTLTQIDKNAGTVDVIRALAKEPLDFEPGSAFQYSLCLDVLAAVYEKATGEKISALYKKYIFEPLNMKNTGFDFSDDVATMYYYSEEGEILPYGDKNDYVLTDNFESGGAGLISTVDDYIRFTDCLCHGGILPNGERLISSSSAELFYKAYLSDEILNRIAPFEKKGYSYGFGCRTLISKESGALSPLGEFGWDGAAGAYSLMDTKNKLSIVYFQDVLFWDEAYSYLHPNIRDLTYKVIRSELQDDKI